MNRLGLACGVSLVLATPIAAVAQTTVSGRVSNVRGGVIANSDVTLRALPAPGSTPMPRMPNMPNMPGMAGAERTTQSGADGTFSFDQVTPGQYVLQVDFTGFERSSQEITVANQPQTLAVMLQPLEVPGAEAPAAAAGGSVVDQQILLDRIKALEQRIGELESGTVLSEPETRTKRIEVWVDRNGNEYDHEVPGSTRKITYERERVYRRQTINEKIEQALEDAESHRVGLGVNATIITQTAAQDTGPATEASGHTYALASADLFFTAGVAQHTLFFADVVALSGSTPDKEINALTLLNSYTARLGTQNLLNLRETWLRTEVFSQKLALVAGRLDLTNYFDHNTAANDETTQFVSDALVNNPALGLAVNGTGVAAVYDAKNGINLKIGLQQSNNDATNLSDSLFSLAEIDYLTRVLGLPEGNYRAWFRTDNSSEQDTRTGFGFSLDQKLTPASTIFFRYGSADHDTGGRDHFYSAGVQFKTGIIFNPADAWGAGYAQTELATGDNEKLWEGYYNFNLTERLRLSFHLQRVLETQGGTRVGYFLPGVRLQASF